MTDYTMTFLTTEVGYIAVVLFLAVQMTRNIGTMNEVRHFRRLQAFFIFQALAQIFWVMDSASLIHMPIWAIWVVNMVYVLAVGLCIYEWFQFIANRLCNDAPQAILRITRISQNIIVVIHGLLIISSIWTRLIFYVDDSGQYVRGSFFWFNIASCYSHWVMTIILIISALKTADHHNSVRLKRLLTISLIPVIGGIFQGLFYNIPFMDTAMTIATIFLFIFLQENQIRTDALTGLNNRAQFEIAFDQSLNRSKTEPFYLYVADIDRFKLINDTYGHLAGDKALVVIAKGLKRLALRYPSLATYRYGGDEFVMLIAKKDLADADLFASEINQALIEEEREAGLGFNVKFSLGYKLVSNQEDGEMAFHSADEMLYEAKRRNR